MVVCDCSDCYDFFFFKQKTAYEMRISDWSSDVCSSDLVEMRAETRAVGRDIAFDHRRCERDREAAADRRHAMVVANFHIVEEYFVHKIGRASCRERVCQYV